MFSERKSKKLDLVNLLTLQKVQEAERQAEIREVSRDIYARMYIKNGLLWANLPGSSKQLLILLVAQMNTNNVVRLVNFDRRRLAEQLNVGIQTVANNLKHLVDGGWLEKLGIGVYMVNPFLFSKGGNQRIANLRKYARKPEYIGTVGNEEYILNELGRRRLSESVEESELEEGDFLADDMLDEEDVFG